MGKINVIEFLQTWCHGFKYLIKFNRKYELKIDYLFIMYYLTTLLVRHTTQH